jgi:MoxR-like ATPase
MSDENLSEDQVLPNEEGDGPLSFIPENKDIIWLTAKVNELKRILSAFVIGQEEVVELMLTGMFSNGHVLLEGVPGVAKTLASKVMSKAMNIGFSRIQFTPDLMPSDVIGTSVFNMKDASFAFKKGPVFSNIVLIDEINRAPAKTQAALFEVMEERQITYDGERYAMEFPFLVVATQNPVEQEGTYNLPEAQLDRFLFRIKMHYPNQQEEERILLRYRDHLSSPDLNVITPVLNALDIKRIHEVIEQVRIEEKLLTYIAAITMKTRAHGRIYLGGSPRASLSMLKASKALSVLRGRDFVTPEDIQYVAKHVLNHRLILTPEAEMEGVTSEDVIKEIISTIEVPR